MGHNEKEATENPSGIDTRVSQRETTLMKVSKEKEEEIQTHCERELGGHSTNHHGAQATLRNVRGVVLFAVVNK